MEEAEAKEILLTLVEPNRINTGRHIPDTVIGWRFPSTGGEIDVNETLNNEEHQRPLCEWTGVTCDPIDGSVTGLNLGNGFWMESLLGGVVRKEEIDDGHRHFRRQLFRHWHHFTPSRLNHDDCLGINDTRGSHNNRRILNGINADEDYHKRNEAEIVSASIPTTFIPSALGKLKSLRLLNLSSNQIQGSIPKSVAELPFLELFDVSSNDLVGRFPELRSNALRVLDLSHNRFHGPLSTQLFGHPTIEANTAPYLSSLVKFDISHNGFNGTIPLNGRSATYDTATGADPSLRNLVYFDVGYNLFSGTICNNFGTLANLEGLFLEHNRFVGTIPRAIYRGSGIGANPLPLVQLFLQQNDLSGTLPSGIAKLPKLKEVYVDGNKLTGSIPDELCEAELNHIFLDDKNAARGCDGISCPVNSASREGVAPCTPCPDDGGYHRYIGQRDSECRAGLKEVDILDILFDRTHGENWNDYSIDWAKGTPACQRPGVTCNPMGQVMEINLSSLGLRGSLPTEIGHMSQLQVLNVSGNKLTGFLPSDLRFLPITLLDIRGNRIQGIIPPLLCTKEKINGNGQGPPGTDMEVLYSCDNIACPKGTWSPIGRASLNGDNDGHERDNRIQCVPCFDEQATFYLGRDHCTDISAVGIQIRKEYFQQSIHKSAPVVFALISVSVMFCVVLLRRRNATNTEIELSGGSPDVLRSFSSPYGEEFSDDDWTAADSNVPKTNRLGMLSRKQDGRRGNKEAPATEELAAGAGF